MHPFTARSSPDRSRATVPNAEPLEDRRLCSHVHADTIFIIPHGPPTPLRTGGVAALVGSGVLLVVTNKPGNFPNQSTIQDDGAGNVTVEWNGHNPPTFHGVSQIIFDGRGKMNSLNFTLTGNVTTPQTLDVQLDGTNSTVVSNLGNFNTNGMLTMQLQTAPIPKNPTTQP